METKIRTSSLYSLLNPPRLCVKYFYVVSFNTQKTIITSKVLNLSSQVRIAICSCYQAAEWHRSGTNSDVSERCLSFNYQAYFFPEPKSVMKFWLCHLRHSEYSGRRKVLGPRVLFEICEFVSSWHSYLKIFFLGRFTECSSSLSKWEGSFLPTGILAFQPVLS